MKSIRLFMKREMKIRDWPQNEVARRSGLTEATISQIMNGREPGRIVALLGICKAFRVTPNTLLGFKD